MNAAKESADQPAAGSEGVTVPSAQNVVGPGTSGLLVVAGLAVWYFAAAKFGLSLAPMHKSVSLVWPPTGIAVAGILLCGYRAWPGIALGALVVNWATGAGLAVAMGIAVGNTLEALAGVYLLRRFTRFRASLERPQDVLEFAALVAGGATTLSSTIGVLSLCVGQSAPWSMYGTLWWQWWLGDAMGALVVAPVLLTWADRSRAKGNVARMMERGALFLLTAAVSEGVFGGWFTTATLHSSLAFAIFPFVIWAAMRFGQREAATTTLVASAIAIWRTARGIGPFAGPTPTESFLLLQVFMSVVAVTGLVMGAAIGGRRRVEDALQQRERRYRDLFENATAMVYTADLGGRFTSLNKLMEHVTGYNREELCKMSLADLAAPPYVELANEMIARQPHSAPLLYDIEILAKDGNIVFLEVNTRLISDEGKATGIQGVARNITKRKQAEVALAVANRTLMERVTELEARNSQILLLSDMGNLLQSCLTAEEAYRVIATFGPKIFPSESGALGVLGPSKNLVEIVVFWGDSRRIDQVFAPEHCLALRRGRLYGLDSPASGLVCGHVAAASPIAYLCVPMMAHGEPLGVLHLQGPLRSSEPEPAQESLSESQRRLAVAVAEHLALALANLRLRETLRNQSIVDPLTGLFNRRYMEETLTLELARSVRSRRGIGIIMLDIDHFKGFNDAHGHDAGDVLLGELAALLKQTVRGGDVACRHGGEEFVLILPEASREVVWHRAAALRDEVKRLHVWHRGSAIGPITISVGVSVYPDHGKTTAILLQAADAALYRAKASGRDRVVIAD